MHETNKTPAIVGSIHHALENDEGHVDKTQRGEVAQEEVVKAGLRGTQTRWVRSCLRPQAQAPLTARGAGQSMRLFQRLQFGFNKQFEEPSMLELVQWTSLLLTVGDVELPNM